MARIRHYVPAISRPLVAALYHEAKVRRLPMTQLLDSILRSSLADTPGWKRAAEDWPELVMGGKKVGASEKSGH